jgi:hypothetical protein
VPRLRTVVLWLAFPLILGLGWIAVTAILAKSDTDSVRLELTTLKSDLARGNDAQAASLATEMERQSVSANARTTGPAWWVAAHIPYIGGPAKTVRGATAVIDNLTHVPLPAVVKAGRLLNPGPLRTGTGQISVNRLARAAPPLVAAAQSTSVLMQRAQSLSGSTWVGKVNANRNELVKDVATLHSALADLATAAKVLPESLGETGTRRYFVAFQTDAEPRGLGGLVGNYAILQAKHGRLRFLRFGSDVDLGQARADVDFGTDFRRQFRHFYGGPRYSPEKSFRNSDPSPNFPYSAQIWMSMWENEYHQHLDGAIATDPTALGYLLGAAGSVTLHDDTVINQANAVSFFENGVYTKFKNNESTPRKTFQSRAAKAVATTVLHEPSGDLLNSAKAMQRAADEGRLLVYSADPNVESQLENDPVGGVLPETTQPFLDVVINNVAANKIGYYLSRNVTYRRINCGASTATITVTIHDSAPNRGLPPYVAGSFRNDPKLKGGTILLVSLYGTQGSTASGVTIDGQTRAFHTFTERGHPVTVAARFFILRGQSRTVVFSVQEPAATGPIVALRQPGVRPLIQTIRAPSCAA